MLQDMQRFGVTLRTATRALAVEQGGVRLVHEGEEELLEADTVVLALGATSNRPLQEVLQRRGVEHRVVGDARRVGDALQAIHEGFKAGAAV